jgi:hypothetical protein
MSEKKAFNLNNIQNNKADQMSVEELLSKHPLPWERRGRAVFDANEIRVNLVDPYTLTGVINLAQAYLEK